MFKDKKAYPFIYLFACLFLRFIYPFDYSETDFRSFTTLVFYIYSMYSYCTIFSVFYSQSTVTLLSFLFYPKKA